MMRIRFQSEDAIIYPDTCEPLKAAADRGDITMRGWANGPYPGLRLPEQMIDEVRYIGMWDASRQQRWGLANHYNEGIEFTLLKRGSLAFGVDGKTWHLSANALTVTRPWQLHRVGNPHITASRLYWLILDVHVRRPNDVWQWPDWLLMSLSERQQITRLLSMNENPVWLADDSVTECFDSLMQLLEHDQPQTSITRLKIYINHLLIAMLDMLRQQHIPVDTYITSSYRTVELFLSELPAHVQHEWTLDAMASECGLSRTQFASYCKQITNMTPLQYLRYCRVEEAARQLAANPNLLITEIALNCGFNSSQHFATVFRHLKGVSPTQYRAACVG